MTTASLKTEITKAIAGINDQSLLEAIYTIVNRAKTSSSLEFELSDEDWAIIEARKQDYKAGKIKGMTATEVRKSVMKKLSA